MKKLNFILRYLKYYFTAQTKHGVHSPFVFDLVVNVINDRRAYYAFKIVNEVRGKLLLSQQKIHITDFGAGSTINSSSTRRVKDIAKNSAKSAKYGELLFRLVNHFKPQNILELGTSLGISTLYQALPNTKAKIITLEGCPETAQVAQANFDNLNLSNIKLVTGNFDQTLKAVLSELETVDYVFFDGNHKKDPTIRYFEECLVKVHNDSMFIFDDIHWSDEMEEAWDFIKNHPKVIVTIDLFFIGLVFFRREQPKQHFIIKH